jgi:hypothetical protein
MVLLLIHYPNSALKIDIEYYQIDIICPIIKYLILLS